MGNNMLYIYTFFILLSVLNLSPGVASVAIDWDPFGPGTARSLNPYEESNGSFTLYIQPIIGNSKTLDVTPMSNANSISSVAPIVNRNPFPFMAVSYNGSDPGVYSVFLDTGFVIKPNEYFFIGGMYSETALDIDFYNAGKVTRLNEMMVASNTFSVTESSSGSGFQTGSLTLSYDPSFPISPISHVGRISVEPGAGNSGVIFLQNTSDEIVEVVQFTMRPGLSSPVYFGVTVTPEPSVYMTLSGFLMIIAFSAWLYRHKNLV